MGKTIIIDHGWVQILKETRRVDGSYTKVGLQEGAKADDMSDLVQIGAANEFGTKRIPERPFIRATFDDNKTRLFELVDREYGRVVARVTTAKMALERIGEWMEAKTKAKIVAIKSPPNAPSTIKRKGSKNPLIDTGQMRQAIRHVEVMV